MSEVVSLVEGVALAIFTGVFGAIVIALIGLGIYFVVDVWRTFFRG